MLEWLFQLIVLFFLLLFSVQLENIRLSLKTEHSGSVQNPPPSEDTN